MIADKSQVELVEDMMPVDLEDDSHDLVGRSGVHMTMEVCIDIPERDNVIGSWDRAECRSLSPET